MKAEDNKEKEIKKAELFFPSSERRTYPRVALSAPIRYVVIKQGKDNKLDEDYDKLISKDFNEKNIVKESKTINLSSGGLLIQTDEEISVGSLLHIKMHMPLPGISCNCFMLGEVVRCEKKEIKKYEIAIKFKKVIHHNLNKYKYATLKEILNLEGPQIKID